MESSAIQQKIVLKPVEGFGYVFIQKSYNVRRYSFTLVPNFGCFLKTFPHFYVQLCQWFTCNIALRVTLHYLPHYITCNIALRATLHFAQHWSMRKTALRATLHYVQHCITRHIVLRATLHYAQHCITCNIALRAALHYVQHCITCNIAVCEIHDLRQFKVFRQINIKTTINDSAILCDFLVKLGQKLSLA